nr:hypothetical protein [Tanacetum cinerariifolium]
MLAPGNYVQWKSIIKRYIDTKPNHELIHYCLKNLPFKYKWADKDVPVTKGSTETTTKRYMENYNNVSQDIHDQLNAEAEAIQIILIGINNDIYSTVDACPNACKMWKAIERLKQGESNNVQDLKTNLNWEFGKFTSWDGESIDSYYPRIAKVCDTCKTESRAEDCLLKEHQNEVNEIRAKRLARTANPLALVAQQQLVYHPQNHPTHYTQNSLIRSQQAATRNRGKAIINSLSPIYDQEPTMVTKDDEIAIQDNSPRISRGTGYIVNVAGARETVARECQKPKRAKDAAYHKEKMRLCKQEEAGFQSNAEQAAQKNRGTLVALSIVRAASTIVRFRLSTTPFCSARECQKPKRAKDAAYHKEKMLLCKQEEAGFQSNAEQADWKDDTDDEPKDQELEAHYMYMA